MLPPDAYRRTLRRDADAFIEIVRSADPQAPVPACPDWRLVDLGRHLGSVHRWAAQIVRSGQPAEEPEGPTDHRDLVAWLTEGADDLVAVLADTDPEAPTWTFGPEPHVAYFWMRRQAQETSIHLVDARQTIGLSPHLDRALAADGIDEIATMFFPRQVRLGRMAPLEVGLRVLVTDAPGASVTIAGDGTDPSADTDVTIAGDASEVLLALWRRADVEHLTVAGDPQVARAVLAAGITP